MNTAFLMVAACATVAGPPATHNNIPVNPNPPGHLGLTCTAPWPFGKYAWLHDGPGSRGSFYENEAVLCREEYDSCEDNSCDIPDCGPYTETLEATRARKMSVGTQVEWESLGFTIDAEFWTRRGVLD